MSSGPSADRRTLAARYVARGWVIFPYEGFFTPPTGWQRSTLDELNLDQLVQSQHPIGLLTGKPSGLAVVDIDARNGGDVVAFLKHYGLSPTDTYVVKSPSPKSWHLYFTYPPGLDHLQKTKGERTGIAALRGVDLLADGAHVFAPPTVRQGHPDGKPDGVYQVQVDRPPAELPEALLADWQAAVVRQTPEGRPVGLIAPENQQTAMELHQRNVRIAAEATEGTRDDVCTARISASIRIAQGLPDFMLDVEKVKADFENACDYPIKDIDGKLERAIKWAADHAWKEMDQDGDLPEGVSASRAQEYFDYLATLRLREAAKKQIEIERLERAAVIADVGPVHHGAEFMANKPRDPKWLVEGVIQHLGSLLLAGRYKSGKSTLMLNLIKALTTGSLFLGRFPVPKPLNVGYVDFELGERMAWEWMNDIPGIDFTRVTYLPRVGQGRALNMRSDTARANMARTLRERGVEVLILDPLSPVMAALGVDENSADTVRPMLDSFDMLKHDAGLKAVVVTHHTGHGDPGRARGSTAFMDWHTSFMSVIADGLEHDAERTFRASGRDVQVNTCRLIFNPETRELSLGDRVEPKADPDDFDFGG